MENNQTDPAFFAQMAEVIARRYQSNADKTLRDVYLLNTDFLDTAPDTDFALRNRAKILQVLGSPETFERLLDVFVNQTIAFTYASNQFIQINVREEGELRRIYSAYLREMERMLAESVSEEAIAAGLRALVEGHFHDLRANITRFFDNEAGEDAQANVILRKVVCSEYTPEMQLELLGLPLEKIIPPVLDIGCGKSGLLVDYLNRHGIPATGVDRFVDHSPHLIQADWLDFPLEPGKWGTVISHMAFTNHFVFQHLYLHGSVEPYARQYMAILRSLKPGSSFYYTPGLPFIEGYLPPETYHVTTRKVNAKEGLYACRVYRLPSVVFP